MNITLKSTNLTITHSLRGFVYMKLEDSFRAFGNMDRTPIYVAVELEQTTHHRHGKENTYRAEATITLPGRTLRAEATDNDIHKAIVALKQTLARTIRKWRERVSDSARQGGRHAKTLMNE